MSFPLSVRFASIKGCLRQVCILNQAHPSSHKFYTINIIDSVTDQSTIPQKLWMNKHKGWEQLSDSQMVYETLTSPAVFFAFQQDLLVLALDEQLRVACCRTPNFKQMTKRHAYFTEDKTAHSQFHTTLIHCHFSCIFHAANT